MRLKNGRRLVRHTPPSRAYLVQLQVRYGKARKRERTRILDEFVQTTNYQRKYAIALLRGKRRWRDQRQAIQRKRRRRYTDQDQRAVLWLADLFDQIGSQRLRAAMDRELGELRRRGHLRVSAACYQRLQRISPSTMDRMRRRARPAGVRPHGGTKPGTLLKSQIPIRTFAEWDNKRPGFMEADLIQHDGGNARGFFACTLTMTDVSSGWTDLRAVPTKAQTHVFNAIGDIRAALPFVLLGIDSDNGAEFINDQLWRYCTDEHITFTRGRVGRKNDNPYVEQKNWSVARRLVGYDRYDTPKQVAQLNRLYQIYGLYTNHFLPVVKLVEKVREGSRVKRRFDEPKTPYQRLLDSPDLSPEPKLHLRAAHAKLDVVQLKQQIDELIARIPASPVGILF